MIVWPWQFTRRAELYHQLGSLTNSGIGLIQALELQEKNPPDRAFRPTLRSLIQSLQTGDTFTRALQRLGSWLPAFDAALLEAGEKSGRLPATFHQLAAHYTEQAQTLRTLLGRIAYPFLLLHVAFLIFPINSLVGLVKDFNIVRFLLGKILLFGPLYAVLFFIGYSLQGQRAEWWRGTMETILGFIPLLGRARHWLAISRLSSALEALLTAGTPIIPAWELASAACGSPRLHHVVRRFLPLIEAGTTPAEAVVASGAFPHIFSSQYHSGELSGRTDETLRHLATYFHDEAQRQFKSFVLLLGGVVYFSVVLIVAYQIISFYVGYYGQISEVMQ